MNFIMSESISPTLTVVPFHDVIIIGAGPCGLAVAARMRESTPSALFADFEHQRYHWLKKHAKRQSKLQTKGRVGSMVVIEDNQKSGAAKASRRSGNTSSLSAYDHHMHAEDYSIQVFDNTSSIWMAKWKKLFAAFDIKTLRSPLFFHPGPEDRDGLKAYAYAKGREHEMCELKGVCGKEISKHEKKKAMKRRVDKHQPRGTSIDERDKQDYYTPSTGLFDDYCKDCVDRYRLDKLVSQADVTSIQYDEFEDGDRPGQCFTVQSSLGKHYARAVVLAIGPGVPSPIPVSPLESEGACHSSRLAGLGPFAPHVHARIAAKRSTNVVVIGGGLTSAQIADMALRKGGSKIYHIMRSDYKLKHFDLSLPWVAKYKNFELATFFGLEPDAERAEMILAARNGGSITPAYDKVLAKHIANGRMERYAKTVIASKAWDSVSKTWTIETEPKIDALPAIDYIYYATGAKADITTLPVMQQMLESHPIATINGLPCLTDELQWTKNVPLFVAGRFAGLRLGPGAASLEGARTGAERIVCRLQEVLEERDLLDRGTSSPKMRTVGFAQEEEDKWEELRRGFERGSSHVNMYSALSDGE